MDTVGRWWRNCMKNPDKTPRVPGLKSSKAISKAKYAQHFGVSAMC